MRPRKASGSNWGRLGGSWEALGLSEGLLGGSWSLLEWSLGGMLAQLDFCLIFAAILDRFGGPNGPPEEPKMELKMNQNRA